MGPGRHRLHGRDPRARRARDRARAGARHGLPARRRALQSAGRRRDRRGALAERAAPRGQLLPRRHDARAVRGESVELRPAGHRRPQGRLRRGPRRARDAASRGGQGGAGHGARAGRSPRRGAFVRPADGAAGVGGGAAARDRGRRRRARSRGGRQRGRRGRHGPLVAGGEPERRARPGRRHRPVSERLHHLVVPERVRGDALEREDHARERAPPPRDRRPARRPASTTSGPGARSPRSSRAAARFRRRPRRCTRSAAAPERRRAPSSSCSRSSTPSCPTAR